MHALLAFLRPSESSSTLVQGDQPAKLPGSSSLASVNGKQRLVRKSAIGIPLPQLSALERSQLAALDSEASLLAASTLVSPIYHPKKVRDSNWLKLPHIPSDFRLPNGKRIRRKYLHLPIYILHRITLFCDRLTLLSLACVSEPLLALVTSLLYTDVIVSHESQYAQLFSPRNSFSSSPRLAPYLSLAPLRSLTILVPPPPPTAAPLFSSSRLLNNTPIPLRTLKLDLVFPSSAFNLPFNLSHLFLLVNPSRLVLNVSILDSEMPVSWPKPPSEPIWTRLDEVEFGKHVFRHPPTGTTTKGKNLPEMYLPSPSPPPPTEATTEAIKGESDVDEEVDEQLEGWKALAEARVRPLRIGWTKMPTEQVILRDVLGIPGVLETEGGRLGLLKLLEMEPAESKRLRKEARRKAFAGQGGETFLDHFF